MAEPFHLSIDRAVFFYERIGLGNIRLWLVVVVIGHKIFHRVVGQHLSQLRGQLGGEGLVVGEDQCGSLKSLNQPGRRRGFSRAGCSQQHHIRFTGPDARFELIQSLGLIAAGGVLTHHLEGPKSASSVHGASLGGLSRKRPSNRIEAIGPRSFQFLTQFTSRRASVLNAPGGIQHHIS